VSARLQRIEASSRDGLGGLLRRSAVPDAGIRQAAADICARVAAEGDAAVQELSNRLGGGFRRVESGEISHALDNLDPAVAIGRAETSRFEAHPAVNHGPRAGPFGRLH